ncbi:Uncharacterized protein BM_BM11637 [Brugia malayi]|uniref:Uncharacterized protein n=2 Tax=Brugia TaxID=6278 RepID=A0A4E9FHI6_BRUMA|nr:Uncharacterized protein BM_BM11637 [Brugia malayi]VIO92651.1 Uncharacterized protein BM_BM11637 [Brugia malayi]
MAYKSIYSYGDGYTTSYSSSYYAYQVGVIFAIVIAGILFFGICAAIIYFGFVKRMRKTEKQRRISSSTASRTTSILRAPTTTYTSLRNEKPPFPQQQSHGTYISSLETPILQSSMHTQPAYITPPPMYVVQPDYSQSQKQQSNYPHHSEISGNVQSHQKNYPSSTTTALQQNLTSEQHPRSFHMSSV